MGLFSTLNTSATGLTVSSTNMNVIGDNIANVNTFGFKASRASFQDLLTQNVIGSGGIAQIGKGARLSDVVLNFAQGTFENSSNVTDMAINGNGFFVTRNPNSEEQLFSRAGNFYLDANGNFLSGAGYVMQGYNADATGVISTVLEDIRIDTAVQPPSATTTVDMTINLNSGETAETVVANQIDLTATSYFYDDLNSLADFSTSVKIYDSLGEAHDMTVYFQKVGTDQWTFSAVVPTEEVTGGTPATGDATTVATGTLNFNTDGTFDTTTSAITPSTTWGGFIGADPTQTIDVDFVTDGQITQYGQESALTAIGQDGFPPGFLNYLDVNEEGIVVGAYSNGKQRQLAQVALATFKSNDGLERRGGNMFAATLDSDAPAIGAADTGGRGSLNAYSLELSNVDLETEFVKMIGSQLGYQANSRVMSTTNDMLQQLVNIVR